MDFQQDENPSGSLTEQGVMRDWQPDKDITIHSPLRNIADNTNLEHNINISKY
jgi:hypothetical protein